MLFLAKTKNGDKHTSPGVKERGMFVLKNGICHLSLVWVPGFDLEKVMGRQTRINFIGMQLPLKVRTLDLKTPS